MMHYGAVEQLMWFGGNLVVLCACSFILSLCHI